MNPYMNMLLSPLVDILNGYVTASSEVENDTKKELLSPILETLAKSLACDDGSKFDYSVSKSSLIILSLQVSGATRKSDSSPLRLYLKSLYAPNFNFFPVTIPTWPKLSFATA